jgi:glyoxylase-like metal-dependent hydrolase (beta-lactamase superfamily II)
LKLLASPVASEILTSKELLKEFLLVDLSIAQLMQARGELRKLPVQLDSYSFEPDSVVKAGDKIDLGAGMVWTVHDTPGHSACHISLYEEKEDVLAIGDAAGFYVPEKDVVWPNYFNSLENYCESIRKLADLPARRAALSHNGIIQGDVKGHLAKAMTATENYHKELMQRLSMGEIAEKIALEKARFVSGLTDIQPFRVVRPLQADDQTLSDEREGTILFIFRAGPGLPGTGDRGEINPGENRSSRDFSDRFSDELPPDDFYRQEETAESERKAESDRSD